MNDAASRRVVSVREFANGMAEWFAGKKWLREIAIAGEVSDLKEFGGGHLGFKLKEQEALLECVLWSGKGPAPRGFENGATAVVTGAVRIRAERSGFQLLAESIELTGGLGELFLLYERNKETFRREGLFEPARKRPVPALLLRLAVISARGKGAEDFIRTIEIGAPFVAMEFVETRVQGHGAEIEIAAALDEASTRAVDAIVLTRGGGPYEDLFPFNLEPVIRAIVRARHPVITAIGHSGDRHLADEVADAAFGTPSLAAGHITKGWEEARARLGVAERDLARAMRDAGGRCAQRVDAVERRLERVASRLLSAKRATLSERGRRLDARSPQRVVAGLGARVATLAAHLTAASAAAAVRFERRRERLEAALDRLDPLAPLARGYAILTSGGGAVRDAATLRVGEIVGARLERGTLTARVESVQHDE